MIYQVVIRLAYTACAEFAAYLNGAAVRYVAAQHDADVDVSQTHCHFAIEWNKSKQALEKGMEKAKVKGRAIASILTKTQDTKEDYDYDKLAPYVCKGGAFASSANHTPEDLKKYQEAWIPKEEFIKQKQEERKKADKTKTHWDIIQEVIQETQAIPKVWERVYQNYKGESIDSPEYRIKDHRAVWQTMMNHLQKNKIRTSRNELERIYVTILRHDPVAATDLYESISKNIFRNT